MELVPLTVRKERVSLPDPADLLKFESNYPSSVAFSQEHKRLQLACSPSPPWFLRSVPPRVASLGLS